VLSFGKRTKKEHMMLKNEVAMEKFLAGYNCAQSVLYAYGPGLGLDGETSLKAATGLGAGMGRRGEVCGALTGGILVLGLKYGRGARQDRSATEVTYQKTLELMAQFEKRHGSCSCRVLLEGCDLRTAEGQQFFKERDLLRKTCIGCVLSVVESLEQLVDAPEARAGVANKS
jgi:C_GCAxxG_C_C family probable redox protein